MKVLETGFAGLLVLEPKVFSDARGQFMETYNKRTFEEVTNITTNFVQDNQSISERGVLRGLHFQNKPHSQLKLVRVTKGEVLDIVVDLRVEQPTFGRVYTCILSDKNRLQLLVPKGFAHGFAVTSKVAEVLYKCDDFYYPGSEGGINFKDPSLNLLSILPEGNFICSKKDEALPLIEHANFQF